MLGRFARQVSRRTLETPDGVGVDQRLEFSADALGGLQHRLRFVAGHDDEIADVRGADVATQPRIEILIGLAERTQGSQFAIPHRVAVQVENRGGHDRQDGQHHASRACAPDTSGDPSAQRCYVANGEAGRHPAREHEACYQGGHHQARDGVEPELGEAGKT